jgi:uncharacterized protein
MPRWLWIILALPGLIFASAASAPAEVIPPAPAHYVNDYANVLRSPRQLNDELDQFERSTSNQIVVAIYPTMQSDSSIDDYTLRIANAWKAGGKKYDNGAILFIFIDQRKMFIQVGYGLEANLPDALCKRIIDQAIVPSFKSGNYNAGVVSGVHALMEAALTGNYMGNGSTAHDSLFSNGIPWFWILFIAFLLARFFLFRRATVYGSYGRRGSWYFNPIIFTDFGRGSWGGGFGGGGGRGGGGGFSGGGGSFGGGGAGGSW